MALNTSECSGGHLPRDLISENLTSALTADVYQVAASATVLGLVFHLSILKPLEVEQFMYTLITSFFTLIVGLFALHAFNGSSLPDAILRVSTIAGGLAFGVLFSMIVYRLFFHRLRRFPGPLGARITKFYSASVAAKTVQYHKAVAQMHEEYGDFIRTGMCDSYLG